MVSCTRPSSPSRTLSFLLPSRSIMHSSNKNDHSIRSALFDATIQLSVPTVTSAAPTDSKARASSTLESSVYSPARNLRRSLSSLSLALPKRFDLHKRKSRRASPTRPPPSAISTRPPHPCTNQSAALVDTNNNPTMISTVSSASEEYLSRPGSHRRSISARSSPTRQQHKSIRNALLGIWQGLNSDDLPSNASTSLPAQYVDEPRVKKVRFKFPPDWYSISMCFLFLLKNSPRWKAFSNVVTSLLTFTRTRKGRYEWIQLVGHPGKPPVLPLPIISHPFNFVFQGTFKEGIHDGFVMKELCDFERCCCELLQNDLLRQFVPMYNGVVQDDNGKGKERSSRAIEVHRVASFLAFIEMEDLLASFHEPCIMDCKIGVRTYLEADLDKSERDPEPRAVRISR